MQIKVCLHFLRTAKKNLEHSLKLGHDYTILHSYQLITHWECYGIQSGPNVSCPVCQTYIKIRCNILLLLAVQ